MDLDDELKSEILDKVGLSIDNDKLVSKTLKKRDGVVNDNEDDDELIEERNVQNKERMSVVSQLQFGSGIKRKAKQESKII